MKHFQQFKTNISGISLPEKFTYPFYYEAHPLCVLATKEVQEYLENQTDFTHNFGLDKTNPETPIGKMFGVLIVKNKHKEIGYLTAFSGKLADNSLPEKFVPPVFNMRTEGSFYTKGESELNQINLKIGELETNAVFKEKEANFKTISKLASVDLAAFRQTMKVRKKDRKTRKDNFVGNLTDEKNLLKKLEQESYNDQFYYKELTEHWLQKIAKAKKEFALFSDELLALKKLRKEQSNYLQQKLFSKYAFLNQKKELKNLLDIFDNPAIKPPAGSGECSAPKLLQYAFQEDLKPIAMAEFWWGKSPNSEIRKHKNFYPSCQGRCKPILSHMLAGIEMEENPLLDNTAANQEIEIIYEDDAIAIINKPAELLSVPGKEITDSVYTRIKKKYPNATGPLIVHRLDMSTSGILVISKTKEANKLLQKQFIERKVKKRYIALLDGIISQNNGEINLPLRLDLDDRPRQLVCYEHGKNAKTKWQVIERKDNKTRIHFYPITGRTHQLRVHASHTKGLNKPIFGDDLYGKKANRLHLHANFIEFKHPVTKEIVSFEVEPKF